jgi:AbrB family looped-hinge helix DNA binding protein
MYQAFTANRIGITETHEQRNLIHIGYTRRGSHTMTTKLSKWGNSLGLRLPKYVEERLAIGPGDYVFVTVTDANEIVVRPVKPKEVHPGYAPLKSAGKDKRVDDEVDDW